VVGASQPSSGVNDQGAVHDEFHDRTLLPVAHPRPSRSLPTRPLISVILPVLDARPWLEEQLRALAAQKCAEPWEVVVVDNGSSDGSRELAQAWCDEHDRFRLVDASGVPGAPAARNVGVRASGGDLLAFCDADDVVHAGWLTGCVAALAHADVVAGVFDFWTLNWMTPSVAVPAANRQLGFLPAGLGANLGIRRGVFDSVGGFAEDLLVGDDIDFCWKAQLLDFRFGYAWDAIVAKREREHLGQVFRQSFAYGRSGTRLYRLYRDRGARPDQLGAAKSWLWLVASLWMLLFPEKRNKLARTAGLRLGRLVGSFEQHAYFP